MPAVVPFFVAAATLAGEGAIGLAAFSAFAGVVTFAIETIAFSALSQALTGKPKSPSSNQGPTTREVNIKGTTEFGQVIYGEVQTAGYIAFIGASGPESDQLWFVIVVADHQCEAITDLWVDDRYIPNGYIDVTTGGVLMPSFMDAGVPQLYIYKYLGRHDQAASPELNSHFTEWTTDHKGKGIAYVIYALSKNETAWPNGAPNSFFELVKGKRVYDPRLDSTNGGSGLHRYDDATTWGWSNNSSLCNRDYMTGGSYWFGDPTPQPGLGIGEPNARMNDPYTIASANRCDELVNIPLGLSLTPGLTVSGSGLTRTVTKTGGVADWGSDRAYSSNPMTSIDLTISDISANFAGFPQPQAMVGFDNVPLESLSYTSINAAWHWSSSDSLLHIYENGSSVGTFGTYVNGVTVLRITYDGANIKYYKDGSLQRTTAQTGIMYVTSVFDQIGSTATMTLASNTQLRYTCDTQLSCGDTHLTNMTTLLSSMSGHIAYTNGKYRLYAGGYDSPAITIGPDDVLGDMELSSHPIGEDLYNYVTGTFYDEERSWKQSTFPSQTQLSYQEDDGNLYQKSVSLNATRSNFRAQRISNVMLQQSRNKISVSFSALSPKAINIGEWETFYLTLPEYGYNAQVFRCLEWKFLTSGLIEMTARIESASAYADLDVTAYTDPATNVPPYSLIEKPQTPTGLTLTGFPTYIKAVVTLPSVLRKNEIVELWQHTSSSPFSSATKVAFGATSVLQVPNRDTTTRYYWTRTQLNGQFSNTYPATTGIASAADQVQTPDIVDNGATLTQLATASSVVVNASLFDSGPFLNYTGPFTAEVTITFTVTCTTIAGSDILSFDFSYSGAGVGTGDAHPRIPIAATISSGTIFSYNYNITTVQTGSGSWTMNTLFGHSNALNTITYSNIVLKIVEIKK